jgi:hypothetical protein
MHLEKDCLLQFLRADHFYIWPGVQICLLISVLKCQSNILRPVFNASLERYILLHIAGQKVVKALTGR